VDVPRFSAKDWLTDSLDTPGATIKRISGRLARLDPSKQRILQQVRVSRRLAGEFRYVTLLYDNRNSIQKREKRKEVGMRWTGDA
jgi:hypothetical protein